MDKKLEADLLRANAEIEKAVANDKYTQVAELEQAANSPECEYKKEYHAHAEQLKAEADAKMDDANKSLERAAKLEKEIDKDDPGSDPNGGGARALERSLPDEQAKEKKEPKTEVSNTSHVDRLNNEPQRTDGIEHDL